MQARSKSIYALPMVTFTDSYAADEFGRDFFRPLMAFVFVLSDEWRVPVNNNYVMDGISCCNERSGTGLSMGGTTMKYY